MLKLAKRFALCVPFLVASGCSDDDGANVPRKGTMSAEGGSAGLAGAGGDSAGGRAGSSGAAGGGTGGGSGSSGCIPVQPDAGDLDAGDAGDAGDDAGDPDASGDGGGSTVVSFAADIQPIFAQRCGPCHVTDGYAGHNVGGEDIGVAYADAVRLGQTLVERINGGGMPPSYTPAPNNCADGAVPGDPGCVTVEELNLVQTWLAQCNPR